MQYRVTHTDAEWRKILSPAAYDVLREAGTEAPFTSPLLHEERQGIFNCAGCALPLYSSATKYDSGTGWPSFWDHLPNAICDPDVQPMTASAWNEPRCIAASAAAILGMCSPTARHLPVFVTA